MEVLDSLKKVLNENSLPERASLFQLQCFVIGKEPTIQGKMHQCLLELKTRKESIEAINLEIEEQTDKIHLLEIEIQRKINNLIEDDYKEKEKQLIERRKNRIVKSIESQLEKLKTKKENIQEEVMFFLSAFEQLSKRETLKQWDDADVQKEYWNEKLRQEVNLRLMLKQLPDLETLKTILALHDDSSLKVRVIEMLKNINVQTNNTNNKIENQNKS